MITRKDLKPLHIIVGAIMVVGAVREGLNGNVFWCGFFVGMAAVQIYFTYKKWSP